MVDRINPNIQSDDQLAPPRRAAFIPIDTRVIAPPVQQDNGFSAFARGLATVNPKIQGLLDDEMAKYKVDQTQMGSDTAIKQALTYSEAVKRGVIPPTASPYFMQGYKEQAGQYQGDQLAAEGYTAWTKLDPSIKDSDNPAAMHDWMRQYVSQQTADADPAVLHGMRSGIDSFNKTIQREQANYTANRVYSTAVQTFGSQVTSAFDTEANNAKSGGRAPDPASLAASIAQFKKLPQFMGVKGDDMNNEIVQAAVNKAEETGNPAYLKALAFPNADGTPGPGSIPKYQHVIDQTTKQIHQIAVQEADHAMAVSDHNRRIAMEQGAGDLMSSILRDGTFDHDKAIAVAKLGDPSIIPALMSFQKLMDKGANVPVVDNATKATVFADCFENGGSQSCNVASLAKRFAEYKVEPGFADMMMSRASAISAGKKGSIFDDTQVQKDVAFSVGDTTNNFMGALGKDSAANINHLMAWQEAATAWEQKHPNADILEQRAFARQYFKDELAFAKVKTDTKLHVGANPFDGTGAVSLAAREASVAPVVAPPAIAAAAHAATPSNPLGARGGNAATSKPTPAKAPLSTERARAVVWLKSHPDAATQARFDKTFGKPGDAKRILEEKPTP